MFDEFCDRFGRSKESLVECSVPGQFTGELNLLPGVEICDMHIRMGCMSCLLVWSEVLCIAPAATKETEFAQVYGRVSQEQDSGAFLRLL